MRKTSLLLIFFFIIQSQLFANIYVFNHQPSKINEMIISPDGKHSAESDGFYVRIFTIEGKQVGEYFDRFPRVTFNEEWRYWEIWRVQDHRMTFLNNSQLAVWGDNHYRKIHILNLDGTVAKTIELPGDKIADLLRHIIYSRLKRQRLRWFPERCRACFL